jgi:NTE family protein
MMDAESGTSVVISPAFTGRKIAVSPAGFGLALGGGGARGLAHIAVLEALDDLGLKPSLIAGTSIGAMIGAAYASGMSGRELRDYCRGLLRRRRSVLRHFYARWSGSLWDYWNPLTPALFSAEKVMETVLPPSLKPRFEDLNVPLLTVATDFYAQSPYVSASGDLLPAVAASAALPVLLKPVELDGRMLMDGGFVNPLPFDLLRDRTGLVVAVDVSGGPAEGAGGLPKSAEAMIGSQQIALRSIINEKLKSAAPDLLIRPEVSRFRVLDFLKIGEIMKAAEPVREEAKRALDRIFQTQ